MSIDALPLVILYHILSFVETRDLIQGTCLVSKKWKHIWLHVPCLNLNSSSFSDLHAFDTFVHMILYHRRFCPVKQVVYKRHGIGRSGTNQALLEKVLYWATNRGVQEIRLNLQLKTSRSSDILFPLTVLNCKSVKRLELEYCNPTNIGISSEWNELETIPLEHLEIHNPYLATFYPFECLGQPFGLKTLTTLILNNMSLSYNFSVPFANLHSLKNLHLSELSLEPKFDPQHFLISAPNLCNLSLICNRLGGRISVDAPRLNRFTYLFLSAHVNFCIPDDDSLVLEIDDLPHQTKILHGLMRMSRTLNEDETVVELVYGVCEVSCKDAALKKGNCLAYDEKRGYMYLAVGSTHTITIEL